MSLNINQNWYKSIGNLNAKFKARKSQSHSEATPGEVL